VSETPQPIWKTPKRREQPEEATMTTLNIKDIRTCFGNLRTFSRITGFSEKSISQWEKGKSLGKSSAGRMKEVSLLKQHLSKVVGEDNIKEWIDTPNQAFDNLKPIEVIERGEVYRIWQMIFFIESGVPT
jgi:DNA-binding transcriptional regulator YiaG